MFITLNTNYKKGMRIPIKSIQYYYKDKYGKFPSKDEVDAIRMVVNHGTYNETYYITDMSIEELDEVLKCLTN